VYCISISQLYFFLHVVLKIIWIALTLNTFSKKIILVFFPPHINLFILTHIETNKSDDIFNRMKWMLLALSMGKIKEFTMEIEVNSKY
jgi:hypothetical protein